MRTYLQDLDAMAWRVEWTPSVTDTPQQHFTVKTALQLKLYYSNAF